MCLWPGSNSDCCCLTCNRGSCKLNFLFGLARPIAGNWRGRRFRAADGQHVRVTDRGAGTRRSKGGAVAAHGRCAPASVCSSLSSKVRTVAPSGGSRSAVPFCHYRGRMASNPERVRLPSAPSTPPWGQGDQPEGFPPIPDAIGPCPEPTCQRACEGHR